LAAAAALLIAHGPLLAASGARWTTSFRQAQAEAKKTGKLILADFTGSDWCTWCVKLTNEVFKTDTFKKWAKENVVLLYLDFPQRTPQAAALKRQNQLLSQKYGVRGFPTILFLTADGAVAGRAGYKAGGPDAWIASVQSIIDNAPKPEKVEPLTDLAQAKAAAAEKARPLLILGCLGKNQATFKALLEDNDFATFANARLVTVLVDTSAAGRNTEDGKAFAALRDRLKARMSPTVLLATDAAGEKLLYSAYGLVRPNVLQARLAAVLPKPDYDGAWLEDLDKAKQLAVGLNRPILMDFAGSDWCTWCVKLDKEVFPTPAFQKLAREKLVLMKVDRPRRKKLPEEVEKQNGALVQRYGVSGFPTLLLTDAAGGEKSRLVGFPKDGVNQVVAWIRLSAK
jgi:protein disulfide-isomerase